MFFTETRARGKIACIELLLVTAIMRYPAEAGVNVRTTSAIAILFHFFEA